MYLAPHLDDVAFSCGGQVFDRARRGERVLVATAFTADPPPPAELSPLARRLHRLWRLADEEVMVVRRREDEAACAVLGVDLLHLDLPDGVYRRAGDGSPLYPTWAELRSAPSPRDAMPETLITTLRELPPAPEVIAPLGAGGHVDHVLVRRAAEAVFGAGLPLYEDLPYARRWRVLRRALGWRSRRWRKTVVPVSDAGLQAKCEAVACYGSQVPSAFDGGGGMEREIRALTRRRGGERLWALRGRSSFG